MKIFALKMMFSLKNKMTKIKRNVERKCSLTFFNRWGNEFPLLNLLLQINSFKILRKPAQRKTRLFAACYELAKWGNGRINKNSSLLVIENTRVWLFWDVIACQTQITALSVRRRARMIFTMIYFVFIQNGQILID